MIRTGVLGRLGLAILLLLTGLSLSAARAADDRAKAILVLDASGSMWGQIDGKAKWDIARAAVNALVDGWNPAVDLGLTVYGHRTKGACDDIEDVIPVGPVNAAKLKAVIAKLSPKGKTPLTASVRRAAEALKYTENPATVILVSDGEETCDLDPCAIASELEAQGVAFTAHVIGFDIRDDAAKAQLKCIADNTGGSFVLADDAASLQSALSAAAAATAAPAPAPAPAPPPPAPAPAKGKASFSAVYAPGVPVEDDDLKWDVYADVPGQEELGSPLAYAFRARWTPGDPIPPGDYIVTASLGAASVQQQVKITGEKQEVVLDLGAAVILPAARESETSAPIATEIAWKVYDQTGKEVGYSFKPEPDFTVPAGSYRLTAKYGDALGEASLDVKPGEKPKVMITLGSGTVEAEIRPSESEPLATDKDGVSWKVFAQNSADSLTYSYKGSPTFHLAAGTYRITATIGEATGETTVTVEPGESTKLSLVLGVGLLKPVAIFAPGAPKPTKDLSWQIFPAATDMAGNRGEMVAYSYDLTPDFKLPAGKYFVKVTTGLAEASTEIELKAGSVAAPVLDLQAGAIVAKASLAAKPEGDYDWKVFRAVVAITGTEREQVTYSYDAAPIWIVPAGTYIVELRIGEAVTETEVKVEAGKPAPVTLTLP
ncbi:vWA domain-containing protein [Zavarzinia aquatilis]|uniref:VWFA domain-containing protein n=1 Tax=Zavarzinia aquatilis TaxID=2211142 RepID=A0A317E898_9PROT|nr:VWA domain-containing protein [Zavarzinia aquatilis]PWR22504.1 hypothetical protein DKG74_11535 [Zavarzinia aquatilis]